MAKKERVRTVKVRANNKQTPSKRATKQTEIPINVVASELMRFKTESGQRNLDRDNMIFEMRKETTNMLIYIRSLLDLLSEVSNVPINVLNGKLMQYCSGRSVIGPKGEPVGELIVSKYNFS